MYVFFIMQKVNRNYFYRFSVPLVTQVHLPYALLVLALQYDCLYNKKKYMYILLALSYIIRCLLR